MGFGTKRRTKRERPNKSVRGTIGTLYTIGYPKMGSMDTKRVLEVHGVIVGDKAFIYPAHGRFGTPSTAKIREAKDYFKTRAEAATAQNPIDGWAWSSNKLIRVKLLVKSDGRHALQRDSLKSYVPGPGFISKADAIKHRLKDVEQRLDRETKDYLAAKKSTWELRKMLLLAQRGLKKRPKRKAA